MPTSTRSPQEEPHQRLNVLAKFFSDYAGALLSSAASTMRIERNLKQMAESWQVKAQFTILPTNVILNLWDLSGEHSYTCISPIGHAGINFDTITRLSRLSDEVLTQNLDLEEARRCFLEVQQIPRLDGRWVLLLASLANASFCRLFGGDWAAIFIVFVATLFGFYLKQRLTKWKVDYRAVTIFSGLTAAVISCAGFVFHLSGTPDIALTTSVLYLVPGVPFCNAVSDLIYGHYVCAMSRFFHAMMIVVSLSIGLCLGLMLINISML